MTTNTYIEEDDVRNAQFGDYVYFTEEYDAGDVIVPEDKGAMVRNEVLPDEVPIAADHHIVEIEHGGRYYELEVPCDVLAMQ